LPYAVIDGNVFRVLSRYFGIDTPIDSNEGKNQFNALAQSLLPKTESAIFNQAIMDFGASICKPQIPICQQCILNKDCTAFKKGIVNTLPVKLKKLVKKHRWFYYFVFSIGDKFLIAKRTGRDIWQNLHEFYLFEADEPKDWDNSAIRKWLSQQVGISQFKIEKISALYKQQLTHQVISGQFIQISLQALPKSLQHLNLYAEEEMKKLSFPQFINQYLATKF
jgi:A/G-specific adenine glycosylase